VKLFSSEHQSPQLQIDRDTEISIILREIMTFAVIISYDATEIVKSRVAQIDRNSTRMRCRHFIGAPRG
jgi:hypothetical protein